MKRFFLLIIALLFLTFNQITVSAVDGYDEELIDEYSEKLFDELSDEAIEIIEKSGFLKPDYEDILETKPSDMFSFFYNCIAGRVNGPVKNMAITVVAVILTSVASAYLPDDERKKNIFSIVSCVVVAFVSLPSMLTLLRSTKAIIDTGCKFMYAFLPILAGLIASCSNPVLALSYNSLTLYLAQIISTYSNSILVPFMAIYFCFVLVGCLSNELYLSSVSELIKNTVVKTLSILSALFVGFLSLKGIFANTIDTISSKGTKLLLSSLVPVIGGALSDAYGAVSGSLTLVKNTVGIVGIISVTAVNLPMILELTLWSLSFTVCSALSKTLGIEEVSKFLSGASDTLKTLNIILIFVAVLFIISTGILLMIRSSV